MSVEHWLWFCAIEFVLCLNVGPSVLLVTSHALAGDRRSARLSTVGVLVANAGYFVIAAAGLAGVIMASTELFAVIKWCGAAYLIWVGIRLTLRAAKAPGNSAVPADPLKAFGQGFLTQAANPNLILYFSAILPQFVDPSAAAGPQFLLLGVSSIVVEAIVLMLYVRTGGTVGRYSAPNVKTWINRVSGGMLVTAGILLGLVGEPRDDH